MWANIMQTMFCSLTHFSPACIIFVQRQWFLFLFTAVLIFTWDLILCRSQQFKKIDGSPYLCDRTWTEWLASAHRRLKAGLRHAWILVRKTWLERPFVIESWDYSDFCGLLACCAVSQKRVGARAAFAAELPSTCWPQHGAWLEQHPVTPFHSYTHSSHKVSQRLPPIHPHLSCSSPFITPGDPSSL